MNCPVAARLQAEVRTRWRAWLAVAAVAVGVAVVAAPLFPLGLGRLAEPDPGLRLDGAALGLGALAIAVAAVAVGTVPALRASVAGPRLAPRAAGVGDGEGRPSRLVGWLAQFGDGFGGDLYAGVEGALADDDIAAVGVGTTAQVALDGERTGALALGLERGTVTPTATAGRAPTGPDELLVGSRTLDQLGLEIGDEVEVEVQSIYADSQPVPDGAPRRLTVVGGGLFPERFGARLGEGVVVTLDGLAALTGGPVNRNMVFVRFAAGVDQDRAFAALPESPYWTPATPPEDPVNFGRVDAAPALIATLMAVVAAALLAHTLATAVRRRRRDLAVLKTLGFARRQVSLAVATQANALVVPALLVGVPVGVALGRWGWTTVAQQLHVVSEPVVPVVALVLVVPGALLVANLAAAAPAWAARRTSPATTLRSE